MRSKDLALIRKLEAEIEKGLVLKRRMQADEHAPTNGHEGSGYESARR